MGAGGRKTEATGGVSQLRERCAGRGKEVRCTKPRKDESGASCRKYKRAVAIRKSYRVGLTYTVVIVSREHCNCKPFWLGSAER